MIDAVVLTLGSCLAATFSLSFAGFLLRNQTARLAKILVEAKGGEDAR